ncbi:porin [Neisseria gonorrhoeae]|uniref:porin n=1 Tax=Neisseria gonorrhoeae TaxID=485 RepID=UPI001E5E3627|nr:porin [Neisseria gonorrhoeae]MCC9119065.1 porin [Neisseria gonorrhoeae]
MPDFGSPSCCGNGRCRPVRFIKVSVQTYRSVEHTDGKVSKVETGSEIADFGSKIGFSKEDLGNYE